MFSKMLLFFLLVNIVLDYSHGQRDKKFFRRDYTYIEATQSFYKIHTVVKTWHDAKRTCSLEGASLFYPENENETDAVISFWNTTQPHLHMFIGISDLVTEGVFETIDGNQLSDVYNSWGPGEPNDSGGIEDCVVLRQDGTFNDDHCLKKFPFICKKSLLSLEWNQLCNIPHLDYLHNERLERCYKFHMTALNWTDAYAACAAEQSYLAVINSQLEANYLVKLTKPTPKGTGNYLRGAVYLGFHNRDNEGWRTVRGTLLEETGYSLWGKNQPDGDDREQCGSMLANGLLNDINCSTAWFFICEHELN